MFMKLHAMVVVISASCSFLVYHSYSLISAVLSFLGNSFVKHCYFIDMQRGTSCA